MNAKCKINIVNILVIVLVPTSYYSIWLDIKFKIRQCEV
jgi:hypothetical protein